MCMFVCMFFVWMKQGSGRKGRLKKSDIADKLIFQPPDKLTRRPSRAGGNPPLGDGLSSFTNIVYRPNGFLPARKGRHFSKRYFQTASGLSTRLLARVDHPFGIGEVVDFLDVGEDVFEIDVQIDEAAIRRREL